MNQVFDYMVKNLTAENDRPFESTKNHLKKTIQYYQLMFTQLSDQIDSMDQETLNYLLYLILNLNKVLTDSSSVMQNKLMKSLNKDQN